jgi:hypothetical protein
MGRLRLRLTSVRGHLIGGVSALGFPLQLALEFLFPLLLLVEVLLPLFELEIPLHRAGFQSEWWVPPERAGGVS